jgi:hypothetical protein
MKHVLITRFALRWPEGNPRRRFERSGWVDYRMDLLFKYTVPSIRAQTFQDFDWLFLVDPSFPGINVKHLMLLEQLGSVLLMEGVDFVEKQPEVGELLADVYKDEWVCSTRIDSDDVIRNDYMELVHEQATEEEAWITFANGYMLKGDQIAPRRFARNPFISYVEYANPFKSVFCISHMHVNKQPCAYKKLEVPGWIQVDHSDNVKNLVELKLRDFEGDAVPAATIYEDFTWRRS